MISRSIALSRTALFSNITKISLSSNIENVRFMAKNKDKKKEKGKSQKNEKFDESQIKELVDVETLINRMKKPVDIMRDEYAKNLSLRSTTGSIESLKVVFDGNEHELQEIGQITRKNPKTIVINMSTFPQVIPSALKAIEKSGMNVNPQQDGTTIFIPVPNVTKEHRENLSKNAKTLFIKCRDAIKDVQNTTIKKLKKDATISEDSNRNAQNQVASLANQFIDEAQKVLTDKQNELVGGKS